jgi:hypothetical protein
VTSTRNILYYGSDVPLPEPIMLRAGPLCLTFVAGEIRDIRMGSREVLRRVYVAVRDRNWRRVPAFLHDVRKTIAPESFELQFAIENKQDEIDFHWTGSIVGESNGKISFTMEGTARSTFWKNRIGFCVLHSSAVMAGSRCSVETVDGKRLNGEFPRFISPHQVFSEIRAISHEIVPEIQAEVRLEGDVYEMEDQRNWSDASYKTYCPPLSLPFPAEILAGSTVSQAVTLTVQGNVSKISFETADEPIIIELREARSILPRIGLGLPPGSDPLSARSIERLSALHLTHLRVDLRLNDGAYESQLQRAANDASRLGLALEVALFLTDKAQHEIEELRAALNRIHPLAQSWLVFHVSEKSTAQKWLNMARAGLSDYSPEARFGCGTDANFAELNRSRPPAFAIDLVSYPLNPQVHAIDHANLIENLQAQRSMVESVRQFAGDARVSVSPVTLRPRSKPDVATSLEKFPGGGDLPASVDPRQMSLLGAAWTAGTLKNLAEAGVYSTTFYETDGWKGVMDADRGSPRREKFAFLPGSVFPLYHLFADVGEFQGGEVVACSSTVPLKAQALALTKGGGLRIILANFTPEKQAIRLVLGGAPNKFQVKGLDESTAERAMTDPEAFRSAPGGFLTVDENGANIELSPLALMRLDRI